MAKTRIQTVCGYGVGSSMFLKMQLDKIAKEKGIEDIQVFHGDITTFLASPCDAVFTQPEFEKTIRQKTKIPVYTIRNYTNKEEIYQQLLACINQTKK